MSALELLATKPAPEHRIEWGTVYFDRVLQIHCVARAKDEAEAWGRVRVPKSIHKAVVRREVLVTAWAEES